MVALTSAAHGLRPPAPVSGGLKIGLLGGSFNPAHEGHLHVSDVALKRLGLDYVWWLVSPQNPLKPIAGMAPFAQRLSFAAKLAQHPRIAVSDIEMQLGTRYTIDTVTALQRRFAAVNFVWLMGSDNLASFARWKRWREIVARMPVAVVMRPGFILAPLYAKAAQYLAPFRTDALAAFARTAAPAFCVIEGPRNAASATAIRAQKRAGPALLHRMEA